MTRQEEIKKIALCYAQDELKDNQAPVEDIVASAFIDGVDYADAHPHWLSVEDELPPIGGIVLVAIPLGGELIVLPISIKNESDFECLSGMTHWMPLPQAPKKGGEK